MDSLEAIQSKIRKMRLRAALAGKTPSGARVMKAADLIIERARREEAAGAGMDRVLFSFESDFEEISDEIAKLPERGEKEAYRDIYAKLYDFAAKSMEDSYMPLYLFILYRYAGALLLTGETGSAVALYEKLLAGTGRLIGLENAYGIHCLERLASAAAADGQRQKAAQTLERMKLISVREFGEESAMAEAVRRFAERMILEL